MLQIFEKNFKNCEYSKGVTVTKIHKLKKKYIKVVHGVKVIDLYAYFVLTSITSLVLNNPFLPF